MPPPRPVDRRRRSAAAAPQAGALAQSAVRMRPTWLRQGRRCISTSGLTDRYVVHTSPPGAGSLPGGSQPAGLADRFYVRVVVCLSQSQRGEIFLRILREGRWQGGHQEGGSGEFGRLGNLAKGTSARCVGFSLLELNFCLFFSIFYVYT
jgi:hypothetical protein